jgi:integrase
VLAGINRIPGSRQSRSAFIIRVAKTLHLDEARRLGFCQQALPGRRPYWGQAILRKYVRPVAQRVGIQKCIGWHTFRHTYSTLLRSVGTEFKVMQELLRHSTLRSTLDVYTQAITPAKHAAQAAVLSLVFSREANGTSQSSSLGDVAE